MNHSKGIFQLSRDERTYTLYQAEVDDIRWVCELAKKAFSETDAIPFEQKLNWYQQNPEGFLVIKNKNKERIGHLDILPLQSKVLNSFVKGIIVESEFSEESILSSADIKSTKALYISSIAINTSNIEEKRLALLCLIAAFKVLGEKFTTVTDLYAVSASNNGERFMRRLGFEIVQSYEHRKDAHNLLHVSLEKILSRGAAFTQRAID